MPFSEKPMLSALDDAAGALSLATSQMERIGRRARVLRRLLGYLISDDQRDALDDITEAAGIAKAAIERAFAHHRQARKEAGE